MSSIMDIIANETKGVSYKTYKYCFDGMDVPSFDKLSPHTRDFSRE